MKVENCSSLCSNVEGSTGVENGSLEREIIAQKFTSILFDPNVQNAIFSKLKNVNTECNADEKKLATKSQLDATTDSERNALTPEIENCQQWPQVNTSQVR